MDRSNVTCRSGAVPGTTLAASGKDQQVAHLPGQSRQNGQKEEQLKPKNQFSPQAYAGGAFDSARVGTNQRRGALKRITGLKSSFCMELINLKP